MPPADGSGFPLPAAERREIAEFARIQKVRKNRRRWPKLMPNLADMPVAMRPLLP